eukprot:CAMPEP_0114268134 /NCGR_PEP_ID=MMETSP0058-20121206/25748_1 /TAXON_ID=36894 /ORGANISM="Pyramimonas parkeae, CCMP726" /LENGTH=120 /DNA_ID=CAMNT_0001386195 /DNA_START=245 /DNA_END=603 /DNA_ORIENTATION=+
MLPGVSVVLCKKQLRFLRIIFQFAPQPVDVHSNGLDADAGGAGEHCSLCMCSASSREETASVEGPVSSAFKAMRLSNSYCIVVIGTLAPSLYTSRTSTLMMIRFPTTTCVILDGAPSALP